MILKVSTHSSKDYEITVDVYDPVELNDKLNNSNINTVAIGDLIISRIDVKNIILVDEVVISQE